jgi:uncharacterized protein YdeI (YjbR/CyaY-like superfamily)
LKLATLPVPGCRASASEHVFDPATDKAAQFTIPPDISRSLKATKHARANFPGFPEGYKRIRVAEIESRKRHGEEQYRKALEHFIEMTARNKRFGFVKEMS